MEFCNFEETLKYWYSLNRRRATVPKPQYPKTPKGIHKKHMKQTSPLIRYNALALPTSLSHMKDYSLSLSTLLG